MDLKFAYANARIKGMKSNLLSGDVIRKMLDVQNLDDIVELLEEQAPYKPDFVEASKKYAGVELVEKALQSHQTRILQKVLSVTPADSRELLKGIYLEYEAQDLKTIASRKALGLPVSKSDLYDLEIQPGLLQRALDAKDIAALTKLLSLESDYASPVSDAASGANKGGIELRALLDALDLTFVRKLASLAHQAEHHYMTKIIRGRLDLLSTMIALRLQKFGASEGEIRRHLPVMENSYAEQLAAAKSYEDALLLAAKKYRIDDATLQKAGKQNSLAPVEIALERRYVEETLKNSRLALLSLATVVGFIFLKNTEVANIRKIALAKYFGEGEQARDMVFAINA